MPRITRRKFLGTGIAAATATGMGYLTKDQWYPLLANLPASKPTPTTTPAPTGTANNPPIADFEYRPLYVKPCIGQEVKFHSLSRDPDGTALTSRWYVNGNLEGESQDFSKKFDKEGSYGVTLEVSNGRLASKKEIYVPVETDQKYLSENVKFKKGVTYTVGMPAFYQPPPASVEQIEEDLDTMCYEQNIKILRIVGASNEMVAECAKMAMKRDFEIIGLNPQYVDATAETHIAGIVDMAKQAEEFRKDSDAIVLFYGNEIAWETSAIFPGNVNSKASGMDQLVRNDPAWQNRLVNLLNKIAKSSREYYKGKTTYAAAWWENNPPLPWSSLDVTYVGSNEYFSTSRPEVQTMGQEYALRAAVGKLKGIADESGKPLIITEVGCLNAGGSMYYGGSAFLFYSNPFGGQDFEEPRIAMTLYEKVFNDIGPYGVIWYDYSTRAWGFMQGGSRMPAFYRWKSYVSP